MLKKMSQKEIMARDDIHIFSYILNITGVRTLEFGALFLFCMAVLVYPTTHFDPPVWMAVPVVLSVLGIAALSYAQYWRIFAKKAILAYDDEFLFVGSNPNCVACVPWEKLDIENSGLADPRSGANTLIQLDGEKVSLKLYTNFVCIPQFENVLFTILTHIKENTAPEKKKS